MHSSKVLLALGPIMAAISNAVPISNPTPTLQPLFTVVSRIPASTSSGVANATTGRFPPHKHTPDCEHQYNGNPNSMIHHIHNSSTEDKGHVPEGEGDDVESTGDPAPYPDVDASSHSRPNPAQAPRAHNHTGYYCGHPTHYNMTATDTSSDKPAYPEKVNASADSSHTHTGYRCAHPSHRNGTSSAGDDYDKRSVASEVDVTVCLGAECKDTQLVTAKVDDSGKLVGIEAKKGNGVVRRDDVDLSYEDFARQMSGARIAGGV